jgi:hypothetical protein
VRKLLSKTQSKIYRDEGDSGDKGEIKRFYDGK